MKPTLEKTSIFLEINAAFGPTKTVHKRNKWDDKGQHVKRQHWELRWGRIKAALQYGNQFRFPGNSCLSTFCRGTGGLGVVGCRLHS